MFCTNCGHKLNENAKFCPSCGTPAENPTVYEAPALQGMPVINTKPEQPVAEPVAVPVAEPAAAEQKKTSVKKSRVLPLIIGGGAAVIIGAGALTWTFARSSVLHLFMGDEKYAASVIDNYVFETFSGNGSEGLSALISSDNDVMPEAGEYGLGELAVRIAGSAAESFGVNELGAELSVQVQPGTITESILDSENSAEVIEELNGVTLKGCVKIDESVLSAGLGADYGEGGSIDLSALIEDNRVSVMVPSVNDTVLIIDTNPVTVSDTAEKSGNALDYAGDIYSALMKHYNKADFDYESTSITVGENDVKCTLITAQIDGDNLTGLADDLADILTETDSSLSNSLDGFDAEGNDCKLVIESYVTGTNKPLGVTLTLSGRDNNGSKISGSFSSLKNEVYSCNELKLNKKSIVKLKTENTSETEGSFRLDISSAIDKNGNISVDTTGENKITVKGKFTKEGTAEVFGKALPLGKLSFTIGGSSIENCSYRINLADNDITIGELFSELSFRLETRSAENGFTTTIGVEGGELGGAAVSLGLKPGLNLEIADLTNPQNTLNMERLYSSDTAAMDYRIAVLERLDTIFSGSAADALGREVFHFDENKAELDELKSIRNRVAVYSGYDDTTIDRANEYADAIYYNTSVSQFKGTELEIIKLYFDSSGVMTILDSCGEQEDTIRSFYEDITAADSYAEVFVWKSRNSYSPIGVTVTRTSDPSKIPSARPDVYSLLDRIYEWDYDNISEDYAVGSYPYLMTMAKYKEYYGSEPEETAKQADERTAKTVEQYNEYAQTAFTEFNNYLNKYKVSSKDNDMHYIVMSVEDGEWHCNSRYNNYFSKDIVGGEITEATEYLSSKASIPESASVQFLFSNGELCGACVTNSDYMDSAFLSMDFLLGCTSNWSYLDGLVDGCICGTYPVLERMTADNQSEILKKFNGTWRNDDSTLKITDKTIDASKVTRIYTVSNGVSVEVIESDKRTVYTSDLASYLEVNTYEDWRLVSSEYYYSPSEYAKRQAFGLG